VFGSNRGLDVIGRDDRPFRGPIQERETRRGERRVPAGPVLFEQRIQVSFPVEESREPCGMQMHQRGERPCFGNVGAGRLEKEQH